MIINKWIDSIIIRIFDLNSFLPSPTVVQFHVVSKELSKRNRDGKAF